jgi:hypothetical protein
LRRGVRFDVFLGNATVSPRARDLRQVDTELFGEASRNGARRAATGRTRGSAAPAAGAAPAGSPRLPAAAGIASGSKETLAPRKLSMKAFSCASVTLASASTPISAPTGYASPAGATMRRSVPLAGDSTVLTIFSVSTSSSGSPLTID